MLSSGVPPSRCAHRARTDDPAEEKPSPAPAAAATVTASGQPSSTLVINRVRLVQLTTAAVTRTRAWPTRSMARPQSGAATAPARVLTPVTRPACPNEPVVIEISRTVPSPVIAIGSRATSPATLKARARGSARTVAYAPSPAATVRPLSAWITT